MRRAIFIPTVFFLLTAALGSGIADAGSGSMSQSQCVQAMENLEKEINTLNGQIIACKKADQRQRFRVKLNRTIQKLKSTARLCSNVTRTPPASSSSVPVNARNMTLTGSKSNEDDGDIIPPGMWDFEIPELTLDDPAKCAEFTEKIKQAEEKRKEIVKGIEDLSKMCDGYTGTDPASAAAAARCREIRDSTLEKIRETLQKYDDNLNTAKAAQEKSCKGCGEGFAKNEKGECEINVEAVLDMLEKKSPNGKKIADFIRKNDVPIMFTDAVQDPAYDYEHKQIYLPAKYLKGESATEVAATIAHEGTHAMLDIENGIGNTPESEHIAHFRGSLIYYELLKAGLKDAPPGSDVVANYSLFYQYFTKNGKLITPSEIDKKKYYDVIDGKYPGLREKVLQEKVKKVPGPLRGPARGWLEFWDGEDLRQYETLDYQKSKVSSWILFWRRSALNRAIKAYEKQEEINEQWIKEPQNNSQEGR